MREKIQIIEVGPRDGFQNIPDYIPLEEKLHIIDDLVAAGVRHIEHTSFVSPKAIPQLRDARELTEIVLSRYPEVEFFPLVPNLYGAKAAWELGLKKAACVVSMSLSHNKANINRTHEESLAEVQKIHRELPELELVLDLATAFGCPFEGKFTDSAKPVEFLKSYVDEGIKTVCLCDTIGIADPAQIRTTVTALRKAYPTLALQVHIHDTRNMGMVNTLAAIECGVSHIQSTLGGLGGCPFAPGASGNLATEDVVLMLEEMGFDTGVDFLKLLAAAKYETSVISGTYSGHNLRIDTKAACHQAR